MSNFSFSHSVFYQFSSNLILSSANSFSLEESKICHLGKGYAFIGERIAIHDHIIHEVTFVVGQKIAKTKTKKVFEHLDLVTERGNL